METVASSQSRRFITVLPHFVHVYAFFLIITWSQTFALCTSAILLLVLLWFSIPPVDHDAAGKMLERGKVSIIGHRGAGADAPENTIRAIRLAKANGAHGVEIDVSYTSDGVPVILHDDSVDRTTDGTGDINSLTWEYVGTLNAAHITGTVWADKEQEPIPSLEEVIQVCLNLGLKMYIDCKADARRTAEVMASMYKKYPVLYQQALVCSFYPQVIYMVRLADPKIVTALIHRPWYLSKNQDGSWQKKHQLWQRPFLYTLDLLMNWGHRTFLWFLCGNTAFSLIKDSCSRHVVSYYKSLGIDILLWTVNEPSEKAYFTEALGLDIITDTLLN